MLRLVCFLWLALVAASASFAVPADALALQQRMVDVFQQNRGAIVRVKAAYKNPNPRPAAEGEQKLDVMLRVGTGFFISKEGHLLVSASRAAGADRVWVEYEGKPYATESVGHDRLTNISVLRVVELPEDFDIIAIDTSAPLPELGSIAMAITCPLDFEPSPAMGMVTGYDKKLGPRVFPTGYLRTSISVDGGQGGCPMFDINGRFIGMSVASIAELDGSYCLPPDAVARVRDDLLFAGKIIHGWMGLEVKANVELDGANYVTLSRLVDDGPAAEAGLLVGDQVLAIAGREIADVSDVPSAIFFTRANQFTPVKVRRGDQELEFSVKTLPRPEKNPMIQAEEAPEADAASEEPVAEETESES